MKKKRIGSLFVAGLSAVVIIAGCEAPSTVGHNKQTSKVGQVLEEQIQKKDAKDTDKESDSQGEKQKEEQETAQEAQDPGTLGSESDQRNDPASDLFSGSKEEGIDYDLTQMSGDMVYAMIYQLVTDPASYEGKTFKMKGEFSTSWYEPTQKNYYYIVIKDALACCSQGMEFIWEDGSHTDPAEYPEPGTELEVTGIFETYEEEGESVTYCRLRDAQIQPVE